METPIILKVPKTVEQMASARRQCAHAKFECHRMPASPQHQLSAALFNFAINVLGWAMGEDSPFGKIIEEWDKNERQAAASQNGSAKKETPH